MPRTSLIAEPHPDTVAAIEDEMTGLVTMDLAQGAPPHWKMVCWACRQPRPLAGFRRYGRAQFCNACATAYEIARSRNPALSSEQFMDETAHAQRDTPGDLATSGRQSARK